MHPRISVRAVIARHRTVSIWLAMLLFAAFASASAQTAEPSLPEGSATNLGWRKVEALPPGQKLRVTIVSRSHLHCAFVSADDASLHCGKVSIARADIKSVKVPHRARSAGLGIVAGLAAAFLIEGEIINSSTYTKSSVEVGIGATFLGAAIVVVVPILAVIYDFFEDTIYTTR